MCTLVHKISDLIVITDNSTIACIVSRCLNPSPTYNVSVRCSNILLGAYLPRVKNHDYIMIKQMSKQTLLLLL